MGESKNMLERMLEQKKQYDQHAEMVKNTRYTCMACGKGDLTHKTVQENAYIVEIDGTEFGTTGLLKQLVACSPECRKQLVPKVDYAFLMQKVGIQKRFFKARLDMFTKYEELYADVVKWLANPNIGLLITGTTGTGKTTLASAIAYELRKQEKDVKFVPYTQMAMDANGVFYIDHALQFIKHYSEHEYLIVDDVAKDPLTEKAKSALSNLFRLIYDNEKKLIITTNFSISEFAQHIDERLESRLAEMCTELNMTGVDKRLKKQDVSN